MISFFKLPTLESESFKRIFQLARSNAETKQFWMSRCIASLEERHGSRCMSKYEQDSMTLNMKHTTTTPLVRILEYSRAPSAWSTQDILPLSSNS